MCFTEDCLVAEATFDGEILKTVKITRGFCLNRVCIRETFGAFDSFGQHKQRAPNWVHDMHNNTP